MSAQRQYKDSAGFEIELWQLVKLEPDWAVSQILHRDELERELACVTAERDALKADKERLDWLKTRIEYAKGDDGMAWATLNWCVEVWSLAPATLEDAIEAALGKEQP